MPTSTSLGFKSVRQAEDYIRSELLRLLELVGIVPSKLQRSHLRAVHDLFNQALMSDQSLHIKMLAKGVFATFRNILLRLADTEPTVGLCGSQTLVLMSAHSKCGFVSRWLTNSWSLQSLSWSMLLVDMCRHGSAIRTGLLFSNDNQAPCRVSNTGPQVDEMLKSIKPLLRVLSGSIIALKPDGHVAFAMKVGLEGFLSTLLYNRDGTLQDDLTT